MRVRREPFHALAVSVTAILGLSACVTPPDLEELAFWQDDGLRTAPLQPVVNRIALTPIWDYRVGSYDDVTSQLAPWIDEEHVFLASPSGDLVALLRGTGKQLWEADIDGQVLAGVTGDDQHVYVGTWERHVYAFDRVSGKQRWKRKLPSEVLLLAAVGGDSLAVRTNDGRISMLASSDGETLWSHIHSSPPLSLRGAGEPAEDGDRVIVGFDDGRLISFNIADGMQNWDARVAMATGRNELERIVDLDGKVHVDQGVAYVAAQLSQVGAVDVTEGRVLWTHEMPVENSVAIDEVATYAVDTQGTVWSLNRKNGTVHWKQDELAYRGLSAPAVAGLYTIVVDFEGYLHWIRITDGGIVARHPLGSPLQAPPEVHLDRIYLLHKDGTFAVYQYVPLQSSDAIDSGVSDDAGS